ncbi:MAG TPA: YgjP-like metallopeptidase domain-containing protein [Candidatus Acidoferrum sp.]|nr:YgjP-like metallopeptidase domain-containing protein [Candidatus Acidoferrum sp.]
MDYRLRVSPWARGLSLRVTVQGGLEVIASRRVGRQTIARILAHEQAWIQTALADAEKRRRTLPPALPWLVPPTITLPAVGAHWTVVLRPTAVRGVRVLPADGGHLVLAGHVGDTSACRQALRRWLLRAGRTHLVPWLEGLSRTCRLPHTGTTIRLARNRWGSCSRTGAIALNARLLLLDPPLVDYILVHELCHTRELNHSPAFWALVAQHCSAYRHHRNGGPGRFFAVKVHSSLRCGVLTASRRGRMASSPEAAPGINSRAPS